MSYYEKEIKQWGIDRNLIGPTGQATVESQMEKLREEVCEAEAEALDGNRDALRLEIGDCYVVIVQLAAMWDMTLEECAEAAWNKIKDRKGMMLQGKFVKQENLDRLEQAGFASYYGRLSIQVSSADDRDAAISAVNANGLKPQSQWFSKLNKWEVSVS